MKRPVFITVCILSLPAGWVAGHYGWPKSESAAGHQSGSDPTANKPAKRKPVGISLRGPQGAALMLDSAVRQDTNRLPALIEAAAADRTTLEFLADVWLKIDPAAFARALADSSVMRGSHRERCAGVLLSMMAKWGKMDPDKSWQTAEKFPCLMRQGILNQMGTDRMEKDPRTGLEFLLRHPGIVPVSPPAALSGRRDLVPLIQQLPDTTAKIYALKTAMKGVPVAEALATLSPPSDYASSIARRLVLRQAARDSLEEVKSFHATATGRDRNESAHAVGLALASTDPAAAVTWARENSSGSYRNQIIREAVKRLRGEEEKAARTLLPESYGEKE